MILRRTLALALVLSVLVGGIVLLGSHQRTGAKQPLIGRVHNSFQPEDRKIFVLVIGSDARHGNPATGRRSDAIHLVGINAKTGRGGILNFPRDSWINVPGYGNARINEALYHGGPRLLAKTLEGITGIHIDYWMLTAFTGFRGIVHHLGGVKIKVPIPLSDSGGSGAHLSAGVHYLSGGHALAFVRDRHDFPHGDIDRTTNQARFLLALLHKLRREVNVNPSALLHWMAVVHNYTSLSISADELFRLGVLATQTKPSHMGNVTVPVTIGQEGAASVVFITPAAQSIYERFRKHASL